MWHPVELTTRIATRIVEASFSSLGRN